MDLKAQYMTWQFWLNLGQYVVAAVVGIYVWISNKDKARSKDIKEVKECTSNDIEKVKKSIGADIKDVGDQVKNVGNRVTSLENSTISHEDLGKVYDRINAVSDQVSELTGTTKGIKGGVDLIHQHLLNGGNKQ